MSSIALIASTLTFGDVYKRQYMVLLMKDAKDRMDDIDDDGPASNDNHANDNLTPIRIISSKPPNDAAG